VSQNLPTAERPAYLAWLPAFLFSSADGALRYILKAWALMLVPSFALSALLALILPDLPRPDFPVEEIGFPVLFLLLVVVSPVVETLIMAPVLLLVTRLLGPGPAVLVSAALWAIGHSLQAAGWGLVVWWPFLVMSIAFLTWRPRGLATACGLVVAIHALQNLVGALFILAGAR
jgi:membrane protease YdiL (CAAX protease family)